MKKVLVAIIFLILCYCANLQAEEIFFLGGVGSTNDETSSHYMVGYRDVWFDTDFEVEASYINTGHTNGKGGFHRTDGPTLSGVYPYKLSEYITLRASLGVYLSFDTTGSWGEKINQELKALAGAEIDYYFSDVFFGIVRGNMIMGNNSSSSIMCGLGYSFPVTEEIAEKNQYGKERKNQIGLFYTTNIPNIKNDTAKNTSGYMVELKREISQHFDVAISWLDEGDAGIYDRQGFTIEPQLKTQLLKNRMSLSIGFGPYIETSGDINAIIFARGEYDIIPDLVSVGVKLARISRFDCNNSDTICEDSDLVAVGALYSF